MAGRNYTPVNFALEKNVVNLFARFPFVIGSGSTVAGVTLDTTSSKGICSVNPSTPTFSGAVSSGSATITSVTSFFGLFTGMQVTGASVVGSGSFTIGTLSQSTGSLVMSSPAFITTTSSATFVATGGQYVIQFGTQAATRLDSYVKLLDFNYMWDEATGSASGSVGQVQICPAAQNIFYIRNNTSIRTIPQTLTSGSTDCTLTIQMGNGSGVNFVAANPVNGEVLKVGFSFSNSTAL